MTSRIDGSQIEWQPTGVLMKSKPGSVKGRSKMASGPEGVFSLAGIMRKDTMTAKLTEIEIQRNKKISKKRYIRFQAGGLNSTLV